MTGYTGFNGSKVEEQSGNYLALKYTADAGATRVFELLGGTKGPVTMDDSDTIIVARITDKAKQSLKLTVTKDGQTVTKTYGFTNLTLEAKPTA